MASDKQMLVQTASLLITDGISVGDVTAHVYAISLTYTLVLTITQIATKC